VFTAEMRRTISERRKLGLYISSDLITSSFFVATSREVKMCCQNLVCWNRRGEDDAEGQGEVNASHSRGDIYTWISLSVSR
jgi:hypothetical protein